MAIVQGPNSKHPLGSMPVQGEFRSLTRPGQSATLTGSLPDLQDKWAKEQKAMSAQDLQAQHDKFKHLINK